jgi:hypothetical protein
VAVASSCVNARRVPIHGFVVALRARHFIVMHLIKWSYVELSWASQMQNCYGVTKFYIVLQRPRSVVPRARSGVRVVPSAPSPKPGTRRHSGRDIRRSHSTENPQCPCVHMTASAEPCLPPVAILSTNRHESVLKIAMGGNHGAEPYPTPCATRRTRLRHALGRLRIATRNGRAIIKR